jgi:cardiolipin synthase
VTAGLFAAITPFSVFRVPLALLLAVATRGNLLAAMVPAIVSLVLAESWLAGVQFSIGAWFWPGPAAGSEQANAAVVQLAIPWRWDAPWAWLTGELAVLGGMDWQVLGPLVVGALLTGAMAAAAAYPATVVVTWTWRAWRARSRLRQGLVPAGPLVLPQGQPLGCEAALARYSRRPQRFDRASAIRLLVDGREAFPEMLTAIDAAVRTLDLETYILADDRTGRLFRDALCRAAQRGVHVRLLYDYSGSWSLDRGFVQPMLDEGVEVAVFHPPLLKRPIWAFNLRNHRKTLIIDGEVTITGGLNIADDYAATEDGGAGWRDTHVRIDGRDMADRAEQGFQFAWRRGVPYGESSSRRRRLRASVRRLFRMRGAAGDLSTAKAAAPRSGPCGGDGVAVQVLGNREFGTRNRIYQAYLHAIRNARRYILVENAYFIPSRAVRRALAKAAARGVLVAIAVARDSDVKIVACASRYLYSRLLWSGVRLFEWPHSMLHAKTAVIDDAWAIVGSYNFDHRSQHHQLESAAVVVDEDFARRLRDQTMADLAQCREVHLEDHESRPAWRIAVESAAYLLRHWL